ncbi:MAG: hypothetical protein SOY94_01215 [Candidatus Limiplasma sp.]|nr:hypothetical protein [Candidatus Limiplasma sp.]
MRALTAYRMSRHNGQDERRYEDGEHRRYPAEDARRRSKSPREHYEPYIRYDEREEYEMRDYGHYPPEEPMRYGRVESRRVPPEYPKYPDMRRNGLYDGGGIGFGSGERRDEQPKGHYQEREGRENGTTVQAGGTFWMEPAKENARFDRSVAEKWVSGMEGTDPAHPHGGKWSPEEIKPLAQKMGIRVDEEKFWEFYAMMNAMYSDYAAVAKKFGVTSPEFYACMAKAWMEDKDAKEDKTALYYRYIVEK